MASWRDQASPATQADFDGLINSTLPFAQHQLETRGAFFPFGAVVSTDGTTRLIAAHDGAEQPPSRELLDLLYEVARSQRASIRAAAFVADLSLADTSGDAIRVDVEHQGGIAIAVVLPYHKAGFGRGVEYDPLRAAASEARVWTDPKGK